MLLKYPSLKTFLFATCLSFFACNIAFAQESHLIKVVPLTKAMIVVPGHEADTIQNNQNSNQGRVMACIAPANDNFAAATALVVNTWMSGTTCGAGIQAGENLDCNAGAFSSVWYKFNATAATMYVSECLQAGTYFLGAAVWNTAVLPTGNCPSMQCQSPAWGPQIFTMQLANLNIGTTYYIQITDPGAVVDNNTFWVIAGTAAIPPNPFVGAPATQLTNPMPASAFSTCQTAYSACYINGCNPTLAQVLSAGCTTKACNVSTNDVYSICYTATNMAVNGQIGIQAYLTSNCTGACSLGNVTWLDWTIYDNLCNLVGCGNINNLQIDGAGCNKTYTICQTFEVTAFIFGALCNNGAICTVTGCTPYMAWYNCSPVACTVLPIELSSFSIDYQQESNTADIYWSTASETNNKEFYIQRSVDASNFETLDSVAGAGNSSETHYYTATDENPYAGISYYRLLQKDFDGTITSSRMVPLTLPADYSAHLFPNPTNADLTLRYSTQSPVPVAVSITDISGKVVSSYTISEVQLGINNFEVHTSVLAQGMYIMKVSNPQKTFYLKFVKN